MFGRRRPLVRAAVVGGAAYHIGKRNAQNRAQQDQEVADQAAQNQQNEDQEQANTQAGSKGGSSSASLDKITQLQKLHESGALTDKEFAKAKGKAIEEL